MGLAIMTELPLVIINSQRGGPSTGLPTKTEQSDLYQAVYGRNGDAPMPVIAARSPSDAFEVAIEAVRIATQYMTPVMVLTDGYIANAAEPWKVPAVSDYAPFPVEFLEIRACRGVPALFAQRKAQAAVGQAGHAGTAPPHRWDREGARHRQHRLFARQPPGDDRYSPGQSAGDRHPRPGRSNSATKSGKLVVVGWGSTFGPIHQAVRRARRRGLDVSACPYPPHLADAQESWRIAEALREDPRTGNEHRPAQDRAARPVPGRCQDRSTRSAASRSASSRSKPRSTRCCTAGRAARFPPTASNYRPSRRRTRDRPKTLVST